MRSLNHDGVRLSIEEAEGGGRPVILIHGWCCDHTYMAPQFEYAAERGHRVIAVDLRGHGASDKPRQSYGMGAFSDDIAWMCGEIRVEKPVIIGHSMGGIVAFDVALRYPALPAAIVMLDAAVVLPQASRATIPSLLEALRGPDYGKALQTYAVQSLFLPTDDAGRKAWILEHMASAPQHVMVAALEGLRDYDPSGAAGRTQVPSLYIAADEPRPRSDMARLEGLSPGMLYGKTVGSGHFCQLEVPEQVNAMIERFLKLALPPGAP